MPITRATSEAEIGRIAGHGKKFTRPPSQQTQWHVSVIPNYMGD
jgi:hypothetical protein